MITHIRIPSKIHLPGPFTRYYVLCKYPDSSLLLLANLIPLAKAWWMKLYPETRSLSSSSQPCVQQSITYAEIGRKKKKHSWYSSTALISWSRPDTKATGLANWTHSSCSRLWMQPEVSTNHFPNLLLVNITMASHKKAWVSRKSECCCQPVSTASSPFNMDSDY